MTERNGKLTRTYTESADLVLVIMNMSQPGRRPEFEAITDLLRRGKPVMVLLTRADDIEKDEVEGCVVEERVMKSDKKRREAAEWVESRLAEILLDTGGELLYNDVQSVSVLYAEENTSQAGLERSGLASLFERLIRVASEQGVAMKRRTPARNLSAFIDAILTDTELDDEPGVGVGRVQDQLTTLLQTIDEAIRRLEERGPRAAEDARHEIVPAVEKVVRSLADGKESGSTPLRSECEALASECEKERVTSFRDTCRSSS